MNQRDKMFLLLGKLEAINFPLLFDDGEVNHQAYYDLIDSIVDDYKSILKELYSDFEG